MKYTLLESRWGEELLIWNDVEDDDHHGKTLAAAGDDGTSFLPEFVAAAYLNCGFRFYYLYTIYLLVFFLLWFSGTEDAGLEFNNFVLLKHTILAFKEFMNENAVNDSNLKYGPSVYLTAWLAKILTAYLFFSRRLAIQFSRIQSLLSSLARLFRRACVSTTDWLPAGLNFFQPKCIILF